jgi:hypothetical protein
MSPDPLLMSADIARVAAERPELDEDLVQALYQHLVLIQGRQPTIDELREYVDRVSSLDHDRLRQRLGLGPRGRRPARGQATSGRGRPRGTRLLTVAIVGDANRALRAERKGRPVTQESLAERLEVSRRTLQDFLRANGLVWPLED